jgi:site-specific recombinase XerD
MEAYLKYYKDNNGTSSSHTITAMKGNIKRIEKIMGKDLEDIDVEDFKNIDNVVDELIDNYSISTTVSTLLAIISYLKFKKASDSLIDDYKDMLNELIQERNKDNNNQEMSVKEEENWIEYPELKAKVEAEAQEFLSKKKSFSGYRNFLIMSLLTLQPPTRLGNYLDMVYKNKSSLKNGGRGLMKTKNYILYNNNEENPKYTFIFNKYKTAKTLGQITREIENDTLNKLLHKWFEDYNTKKQNFLVNSNGGLTTQTGITNGLSSISKKLFDKKLTGNSFRHIFITHFLSTNPSIQEKQEVLKLVGQNYKPTQAEKYARIKKEDN